MLFNKYIKKKEFKDLQKAYSLVLFHKQLSEGHILDCNNKTNL